MSRVLLNNFGSEALISLDIILPFFVVGALYKILFENLLYKAKNIWLIANKTD
ncbi:MAG: hypothetical protein K2N51_07150 [Lachnospiraceae bacterium]|nr:hypothetical protein [Lachnospiraceae bacterium]